VHWPAIKGSPADLANEMRARQELTSQGEIANVLLQPEHKGVARKPPQPLDNFRRFTSAIRSFTSPSALPIP